MRNKLVLSEREEISHGLAEGLQMMGPSREDIEGRVAGLMNPHGPQPPQRGRVTIARTGREAVPVIIRCHGRLDHVTNVIFATVGLQALKDGLLSDRILQHLMTDPEGSSRIASLMDVGLPSSRDIALSFWREARHSGNVLS